MNSPYLRAIFMGNKQLVTAGIVVDQVSETDALTTSLNFCYMLANN